MEFEAIRAIAAREESNLRRQCALIGAMPTVDNFQQWLIQLLSSESELGLLFGIPRKDSMRDALTTILQSGDPIGDQVRNLYAGRVSAQIATTRDVDKHRLRGDELRDYTEMFGNLRSVLSTFESEGPVRTVNLVVAALSTEPGLRAFKSRTYESDLRVILRTLYLNPQSEGDDVDRLLSECLRQIDVDRSLRPRALWWAIETMFARGSSIWHRENSDKIATTMGNLLALLTQPTFAPPATLGLVPELDNILHERCWSTINATRVALTTRIREYGQLEYDLHEKIDDAVDIVFLNDPATDPVTLREQHAKLILAYETLALASQQRAYQIAIQDEIDLRGCTIDGVHFERSMFDIVTSNTVEPFSEFADDRNSWSDRQSTTLLLSARPGQGKSRTALAIANEVVSSRPDGRGRIEQLQIGKEIKSPSDVEGALGSAEQADLDVVCLIFDEFDKAKFDFPVSFLNYLEKDTASVGPVIVIIFTQSRHPTRALLAGSATGDQALNDFLTRVQNGIDLPSVADSPDQRVCTAVGMLEQNGHDVKGLSRELLAFLCLTPIKNMRELRAILRRQPISNGAVTLNDGDRVAAERVSSKLERPTEQVVLRR